MHQIRKWRRKKDVKTTWIDRQSFKELSEKIYELYMEQPVGKELAFLEVTLPDYGVQVLYSDTHNTALRNKYNYPKYLVRNAANYASQSNNFEKMDTPTQAELVKSIQ